MTITLRPERRDDGAAVAALIPAAFRNAPHSDGTEAAIVERLRNAGALTALIAEDADGIVGHVAFSPVTIDGAACDWVGLGPVAVDPLKQGRGIGSALIERGLADERAAGRGGCVVLGDPAFYHRFGFRADPALTYPDVPLDYFQWLAFGDAIPNGVVAYHPAFTVDAVDRTLSHR